MTPTIIHQLVYSIETIDLDLGRKIYAWYKDAKKPNPGTEIFKQQDVLRDLIAETNNYTAIQNFDVIISTAYAQSSLAEGHLGEYYQQLSQLFYMGYDRLALQITATN